MNLQFTLSRTWLWLITLAVALIITGVIAFCWIDDNRAVRYQADAQRYDLRNPSTARLIFLLDRKTGKTVWSDHKDKPLFPEQNEE